MQLIIQYFQTLIFSITLLLSIIGIGTVSKFLLLKNFASTNIFFTFTFGIFLSGLISLGLNFIFPLNYISNYFLLLGLVLFIINLNLIVQKKKFFFKIIIFSLIVSIMVFKSLSYNDYELYHLPYQKIISSNKIIFGLSNFDYRFGHPSIFQNISSLFYNKILGDDSFVFITPLIFVIYIDRLLKFIRTSDSFDLIFISLFALIYFAIHGYRYGALGNDMPAHLMSVTGILITIEAIRSNKLDHKFILALLIGLIVISAKILLIINLVLLMLFFNNFYKNKHKFVKIIFLSFLFIVFFLSKNFVNTSCLSFPIKFTCIETSWHSKDYSFFSPEVVSMQSSVAVKDFMNAPEYHQDGPKDKEIRSNILKDKKFLEFDQHQKKSFIEYQVLKKYDSINIWIKFYLKNHFKNVLFFEIIILLIVYTSYLIFAFLFSNINKKKIPSLKIDNIIYIVLFLVLLMITIWFFKAPQVRYGLSFLIIFSSYPIILFSNYFYGNYYQRYPSLVIEKFINYLLTFLLIFFISKNILRIFEFYPKNEFYNDNLVPLKNTYFNSKTLNNFKFQFPNNNLCGNSELICTNFYTKFIESEPDISKKNGYLFITNK